MLKVFIWIAAPGGKIYDRRLYSLLRICCYPDRYCECVWTLSSICELLSAINLLLSSPDNQIFPSTLSHVCADELTIRFRLLRWTWNYTECPPTILIFLLILEKVTQSINVWHPQVFFTDICKSLVFLILNVFLLWMDILLNLICQLLLANRKRYWLRLELH